MVRDATARLLSNRLETEQSESRLPAVVASVVRDGRVAWRGGAGSVDGSLPNEETQFRCGSITKTFVAVEVMRLRDEGLLDLADPITKHLPELEALSCNIAHLLSHTSGLRAETSGPWWERTPGGTFEQLVASSIRPEDIINPPGRRFHYSNVGFAVLGELIGRLRRAPWDDVISDELLRPLGMVRTSTRPVKPFAPGLGVHPHADVVLAEPEHDAGAMAPAGQLWSTTEDLSRWIGLLAGRHQELLSPATAAEMRQPIAVVDVPEAAWTAAHGLGLQLFNDAGERSYGHGGSMPGFLAMLRIDARSGDGIIVMTDATSGLRPSLEQDLLALCREHEPRPVVPWQPAPGGLSARLLDVAGSWYWGTRGFVATITREGLVELTALAGGREGLFRPTGEDTFVGLSGYYEGETLQVVRRQDGKIAHLDIGSFVLTRTPYDKDADLPGGFDRAGWTGSPPLPGRHGLLGHSRRRDSDS